MTFATRKLILKHMNSNPSSTTGTRAKPKARVDRVVGLNEIEWNFISKSHPDLALQMIRNKVRVVSASVPDDWMDANFKGLFYVVGRIVCIEEESDTMALKLKIG